MSGIIKCDTCGRKVIGQLIGDTLKCPSCGEKISEEEFEVLDEGGHEEKTDEVVSPKNKLSDKDEEAPTEDAMNEKGGKETSISTKSAKRIIRSVGDQVKVSCESTKEHFKENPKLPFKIGLGVSCFCFSTFGALILDGAGGSELIFYQAAMISSAVMVHLFASLLFRGNEKT